jgi:probable rRNA maturation factor
LSAAPRVSLAVQYAVAPTRLPRPATLRRWAGAAVDREASVTLRFVGRREGRALNARYRGAAHPTNVLAFVYDDSPRIEGDVVLCAPVLREEARAQGKALTDHCAISSCTACSTCKATTTTPTAPRERWRRANRQSSLAGRA